MPNPAFLRHAAFAAGIVTFATSGCKSGRASASGEPTCESVAAAVREQFHLATVTISCPAGAERTASVEVVDAPLMHKLSAVADSAAGDTAAELLARAVWARAGIPLKLAAIAVTLSAAPDGSDANTMYTFGRGLVSYWEVQPADTTRDCLTGECS